MNTTPAASFREESAFYLRYALFQFRERFTEFGQAAAFLLMYPILVWLLTHMWGRFGVKRYQSLSLVGAQS